MRNFFISCFRRNWFLCRCVPCGYEACGRSRKHQLTTTHCQWQLSTQSTALLAVPPAGTHAEWNGLEAQQISVLRTNLHLLPSLKYWLTKYDNQVDCSGSGLHTVLKFTSHNYPFRPVTKIIRLFGIYFIPLRPIFRLCWICPIPLRPRHRLAHLKLIPTWHVYQLGSLGLIRYFYGNLGAKGLRHVVSLS